MLAKIIYNVGSVVRNPSVRGYLKFIKKTESWTRHELLDYQLEKTKIFLEFVRCHSPYYKNLFASIGFLPLEIKTLEELKAIPSMTKAELLKNNEAIHTLYPFKKTFLSETSGTSGQPLKFKRNEEWDSHNRATMFRGYSWHNVKPWDRNGYLWGYNIDSQKRKKIDLLDRLQNRFRVFSYEENQIEEFTKKLESAQYLHGYSSMIYEVAKLVNKLGLNQRFNLKMIKGTSEKIYDSYQEEIEKAFGQKMISEYGAAESGLIAFECEKGKMHINVENVIVEEEGGEIIITNLLSKSFPIIRYKLGDSIKLAPDDFECSCGRKHPVLLDVVGRIGKVIVGKEKSYPSLSFYYVFKNIALEQDIVLNYQAIQTVPGIITLKIEQSDEVVEPYIRTELKKYFGDDVSFEIKFGEQLHSMEGKLRDFITELN